MNTIFARSLYYFIAAVVIAVALALPTRAMADLITLNIPGITGDVTVAGQRGTIEVLSVTGNATRQIVSAASGAASRESSTPVFSDLTILKRLDSSSPALFLYFVSGNLSQSAVITFLHSSARGFTKFFTITLYNFGISKFATNDTENGVLGEQITLNFTNIILKDEVTGQSACYDLTSLSTC